MYECEFFNFIVLNEFADGLNSRLQELLFIRGANFERDSKLLEIVTSSFDSHGQLILAVNSYIDKYINFNLSPVENGVSLQVDPRNIFRAQDSDF